MIEWIVLASVVAGQPEVLAGHGVEIASSDGAWIDSLVSDQRVVLVGEELHGIGEHIDLKIEVASRLLREHAFTHVAIEDDVFKVGVLNTSVQEGGPVSLGGLYWCWNVVEMQRGLESLMSLEPAPVLIGFDVQSPRAALASMDAVCTTTLEREAYERVAGMFAAGREAYARQSPETLAADAREIERLSEEVVACRAQLAHLARVQAVWAASAEQGARMQARDRGMAASILDVLEADPSYKVVVFAHNAHAGYEPFYESFTGGVTPLGRHLRDAGVSTLSIGAVFTVGTVLLDPRQREAGGGATRRYDVPEPNTQAAWWVAMGHERWLLRLADVERGNEQVDAFLTSPPPGHFNNYGPARALGTCYDVIVGNRQVTPATPVN